MANDCTPHRSPSEEHRLLIRSVKSHKALLSESGEMNDFTPFGGRGTWGYPKIFDFNAKKESLESAKIQAFL